jgi:two-component system cell cycle sensor histidine kinase/response regulator CckA
MLETSLPKDTSLKLAIDEQQDPHVVADAAQLRHVLLNLAINAGQAMGGDGWFAIRARAATPVEVSAFQLDKGKYVAIEAEDSGSGMADDTLKRIFQPYFTTKQAGHGTGLGLSVVEWIISRNQGGISVTSKLGVGTVFTLLLPAAE